MTITMQWGGVRKTAPASKTRAPKPRQAAKSAKGGKGAGQNTGAGVTVIDIDDDDDGDYEEIQDDDDDPPLRTNWPPTRAKKGNGTGVDAVGREQLEDNDPHARCYQALRKLSKQLSKEVRRDFSIAFSVLAFLNPNVSQLVTRKGKEYSLDFIGDDIFQTIAATLPTGKTLNFN